MLSPEFRSFCHNPGIVLREWEKLAGISGWELGELHGVEETRVICLENEAAASGRTGGIYVSAGVHGDECAPVWALLEWVRSNWSDIPDDLPVLVFPCMNPVGLSENTRRNGEGIDLNRHFHDSSLPLIARWQEKISGRRFDLAINLHEDFDATGVYLYELGRSAAIGETLIRSAEPHIPRETATLIDGADFAEGLLFHGDDIAEVISGRLNGGYPEAIQLFLHHTDRSITFETPSEHDLDRRIEAHFAFLDAVLAGRSLWQSA